jgi:U3 small nucleolar RNA-associated protein 15
MTASAHDWRLPLRKLPATIQAAAADAISGRWAQDAAAEVYTDRLFGSVGCVEYNSPAGVLALTARSHSVVLRVPISPHSGAVWNEQTSRAVFATRFRADGKLAAQAVERRVIVRSTTTAFERAFIGHTRDVRDVAFLAPHIVASVSDDATLRLWELTSNRELVIAAGAHTDYIRAIGQIDGNTFATGGYDKQTFVWDVRTDMSAPVLRMATTANAVERVVAAMPGYLATAAGDVVALYDLRGHSLSNGTYGNPGAIQPVTSTSLHTKTVAALSYVPAGAAHDVERPMLVTGSLDKRIKFNQVMPDGTLNTIATRKAAGGVTALAVRDDATEFAYGTTEGTVSVFKLHSGRAEGHIAEKISQSEKEAAQGLLATGGVEKAPKPTRAERQAAASVAWLKKVHAQLAHHRYQRALRTALFSKIPDVLAATLDELARRCALHVALANHDDRTILQLLKYALEYVDEPEQTESCLLVLDRILEIYAPAAARAPFFHKQLLRAHHRLAEMARMVEDIAAAASVMELVAESASLERSPDVVAE